MAIVKIEYNLEFADDRQAHLRAIKSTDLALVIWDFLRNSRKKVEQEFENNPLANVDVYDGIERTYEKFNQLLLEYKIDIDELID